MSSHLLPKGFSINDYIRWVGQNFNLIRMGGVVRHNSIGRGGGVHRKFDFGGGHNKFDRGWVAKLIGEVIWGVEVLNSIGRGWQSRKKCKISSRPTDPTFKLQAVSSAQPSKICSLYYVFIVPQPIIIRFLAR